MGQIKIPVALTDAGENLLSTNSMFLAKMDPDRVFCLSGSNEQMKSDAKMNPNRVFCLSGFNERMKTDAKMNPKRIFCLSGFNEHDSSFQK